jgi:hypothetical protein
MPRRKRPARGQLELIPSALRPLPKEFAERLQRESIVSKRVKRQGRKPGQGKTVNVEREIERAYSLIENIRGINIEAIVQALKAPGLSVESIMADARIFSNPKRSQEERKAIRQAAQVIVGFAKRKSRHRENARMFAPKPGEAAERARQKRHLETIRREKT